jgi:hypothetical protein
MKMKMTSSDRKNFQTNYHIIFKTKLGQNENQNKKKVRKSPRSFLLTNQNQTIRPTTIPKPAINIALAPSIFIEIAPFELEPPSPVDDGFELVPYVPAVVVAVVLVVFVAFALNAAPIASAFPWYKEKELLLPSGPALIANTMPLPQWLSGVFAAWAQ